jgi:hypothetical protein
MKLEQQLRETIARQHKAKSTADVYWHWCERFIRFAFQKRGQWVHPKEMGLKVSETLVNCGVSTGIGVRVIVKALLPIRGKVLGAAMLRPVLDPVRQPFTFPHLDWRSGIEVQGI